MKNTNKTTYKKGYNRNSQEIRFTITPITYYSKIDKKRTEKFRIYSKLAKVDRRASTLEEAHNIFESWQREENDYKKSYSHKPTSLTFEQIRVAETAFHTLGDIPLNKVISFYLNLAPKKTRKVKDAFKEWIDEGTSGSEPLSKRTINDRISRLRGFVKEKGESFVHVIDRSTIESYINSPATAGNRKNKAIAKGKASNRTKNRRLFNFRAFFNFCENRDYIAEDALPTAKIKKFTEREPNRETLSIDECKSLVNAAVEFDDGSFVPYVVISLFVGLRKNEIKNLKWSDINLSENKEGYGRIMVTAQVSKTNSLRTAYIPPNAIQLLKSHAPSKGKSGTKIFPVNFEKKKIQLKELAGITLPNNCLRHTAATAWYNEYHDMEKVAEQLGNSAKVARKHYVAQAAWDKNVDELFEIGTTPSKSV